MLSNNFVFFNWKISPVLEFFICLSFDTSSFSSIWVCTSTDWSSFVFVTGDPLDRFKGCALKRHFKSSSSIDSLFFSELFLEIGSYLLEI